MIQVWSQGSFVAGQDGVVSGKWDAVLNAVVFSTGSGSYSFKTQYC